MTVHPFDWASSSKMICPGCDSESSTIKGAWERGEGCPCCGLSSEAMTEARQRAVGGPAARPDPGDAIAVTDLVQWLTEQIDQDEQVAQAATVAPWMAADSDTGYDEYKIEPDVVGPGYEGGGVRAREDADHIVRHDPSRVFRQVAAYRRILARHQSRPDGTSAGRECSVCVDPDGRCDSWQQHMSLDWPCPDVRDLASIYSDRPGFDPSWTVE